MPGSPNAGARRPSTRRSGARADRDPAAADRHAAADRPAGRQDGAEDRRGKRRLRPGRPVIRDLSFAITGPERVAVTGPNGSGKTTLLALVTGRLAPVDRHGARDDRLRHARPAGEPARPGGSRSATTSGASIPTPTRTPAAPRSPASCSGPTRRCRPCDSLSGGQMLRAGLACVLGGQAAAAADPRRADQPPRHRLDRGGGGGPAGLRRRAAGRQPRRGVPGGDRHHAPARAVTNDYLTRHRRIADIHQLIGRLRSPASAAKRSGARHGWRGIAPRRRSRSPARRIEDISGQ